MQALDWKPVKDLPKNLPTAPNYGGEAFPDPLGPDSDNVVVAHSTISKGEKPNYEIGMGVPWADESQEDPENTTNYKGEPYQSHKFSHRILTESFDQALAAAAQIAMLPSDMTLSEVGTVALLQAKNGAYYVAAGLDHDELNYSCLEDFTHSRRTHPQVLAVTDGVKWVDLREAKVGPPSKFGGNDLDL